MGRSVKDEMEGSHQLKSGGEVNWIQKAVNPANKGKLHKSLGVPADKTISMNKLDKALHSKNPTLKKEAQFAKNVRKLGHKK